MLSEHELSTPGSPAAQRWITRFGWGLAVVWGAFTVAMLGRPPQDAGNPYSLGDPSGLLPLQLASYSFVHYNFLALAGDLIWLAAIVRLSRRCLGFDGFVRLYSVGVIGGGLACLGISRSLGAADSLRWVSGGFPSFAVMLAALAVLHPREKVFLWGERGGKWILGPVSILHALPVLRVLHYWSAITAWVALNHLLAVIHVGIIATRPLTTPVIVLIGVVFTLITPLTTSLFPNIHFMRSNTSFELSYAAGIVSGLLYGTFERLWARHLARVPK